MEANKQSTTDFQHSKKKIAILTIAVLIMTLAVGLTAGLLLNSQNPPDTENTQNSWIAKGAYATYEGQANILSTTVLFNAKMEITDLNETHLQISTYFNMSTPFGNTENTTTIWVSRENMTFQPDELTLNSTHFTELTLPNIGTRSCTVYEYKNQDIGATYYIDTPYIITEE